MPDPVRDAYAGLAALLRAGVTLADAVRVLRGNGTLGRELGERLEATLAGRAPLSAALEGVVPSEEVALVQAGEETGRLDANLDRLVALRDRRAVAIRRLWSAAGYPILLFHMTAMLAPLPGAVARRDFPAGWFVQVLALLLPAYAALLAVVLLRRTAEGEARFRRIVDRLPGFGSAARHGRRAAFTAILAAGYESGIPLDRALGVASRGARSPDGGEARAAVERGEALAVALARGGLLAPDQIARVSTAELAGNITAALESIAAEEAELAETGFLRSCGILGKILWGVMAAWIAWFAIATILRIYGPLL
ncbi:MAG: type II secretion system F family protein [Planctomycetaceae bacterium]